MLILISALIIDTVTANIYDLISKELASSWGLIFFISNSSIIFVIGLQLLLGYVKKKSKNLRTSNSAFNKLYKLVKVAQFLIISVFLIMVIQIITTSQYSIIWLIIIVVVSSIPFYLTLSLLTYKFFSWYRSNTQNVMVLLYGLVAGCLLMGQALLDIGVNSVLLDAPVVIESTVARSQVEFPSSNSSYSMTDFSNLFLDLATMVLIIDFILLWIASAVLLYRYSCRLVKSRIYWMTIFLPLGVFIFGLFPTLLGVPTADFVFFERDIVPFRILATLATIAGVLLFGISFIALSRRMQQLQQKTVSDYLKIAGYGIALLPICIVAGIVFVPYPPVGSATCTTLALASYLFYIGIYSSAISISENAELRRSIRRTAEHELKLLDNIGTAQMHVQLQDKVTRLVKEYADKMTSEAGVHPYLSQEDVKQYLDEVMKELDDHRSSK